MNYWNNMVSERLQWCSPCGITPIIVNYGALYNPYAIMDIRGIAPAGWHVPTRTEIETLLTYLGGDLVAGIKLKEIGLTYWNAPNTGSTNEVGFNLRGAGARGFSYIEFKEYTGVWTSTFPAGVEIYYFSARYNSDDIQVGVFFLPDFPGYSMRWIKDDSNDPGFVIGNNGNVYSTVKIDNQVYTNCNVIETKYTNGDLIPVVTDDATWMALITGAMCYFNNDPTNA